MFLFNLSLAEFLVIFGAVSGLVVTLYLLDRSRRRQKVPTLKFWLSSQRPTEVRHRRRIQQPLSLILQLAGIALLLLALAQLKLGSPDRSSRDHILILDTSAWMGARIGNATLMDAAQASARAWLRVVPAADRVMLVRADSVASPATAFETNREILLDAIRNSRPTSAALNIDQALGFASRVRNLHARRGGEIIVIGSGRIPSDDTGSLRPAPAGLRYVQIPAEIENCGLRKIGLRRSAADPDLWQIFVSVRNYGLKHQTLPLMLQFGGAPAGSQEVRIAPGTEQDVTFEFKTRAAGWMEARLLAKDGFPADDRAVLELPAQKALRIAVYSDAPELLRPLFANTHVQAEFLAPSAYQAKPAADIVIIDRFRPPAPPQVESIWIEPPPGASPITLHATRSNSEITRWRTNHPLGAGLRVKGLKVDSTQIYSPAQGDITVAESDSGAAILARPGKPKQVVLGFHPMRSEMRYELATPLLFANIIGWMSPEIFRRWELNASSVGTVNVPLESEVDPASIKVVSDAHHVPYTVHDGVVRFFSGTPSTVRVLAGDREMVYSLALPEVADSTWSPPADVRRGLPRGYPAQPGSRDLWRWLALAGAATLLVEWLLFGRRRALARSSGVIHRLRLRIPWRSRRALRRAS